jgi:hypothetical protein
MSKHCSRRGFLKNSLAAGGAALAWNSLEEQALGAETTADRATAPSAEPLAIPKGTIKDLEISRVFCGGNLMGGWAHSRDLIYVSPLIKAYHTDEKIFETLRLAEHRGINTVLINPACAPVITAYRKAGGKIQWISDCASGDIRDAVSRSVDGGADAIYLQGGICDKLVRDGQIGGIEQALGFMKDQMVPCGLGAHCLETVKQCAESGFDPDFWVKTLHRDDYWSATPEPNRRNFDELKRNKEHEHTHDNMWCTNPAETIAYMASLRKPWIAFKTLAAGAIHPRQAFQWCFENGADFLCVGMFDFQIVENTTLAVQALAAVAETGRPRAWMA